MVRATADWKRVDLKCATVIGPMRKRWYTQTHTHSRTITIALCCKLTHAFILSKRSYDKGIVRVLWLPQMGLPDLRDDVIGFFERLRRRRREKESLFKALAFKK